MTTAPVFFCPDVAAGELRLAGDEGRHAAGVRRLTVGERLDLVDGTGRRGLGVVLSVHGRDALTVGIETVVDEPAPDPAFVVVQALPKGDRGELAVELMTEAGVDEIVPWAAARAIVHWSGERGAKSLRRWRSSATEAAKQSRRARWPVVAELAATPQVVRRAAKASAAYVLAEDAGEPLAGLLRDAPTPGGPATGGHACGGPASGGPASGGSASGNREIVIVVGPEGGLEDGEVAALTAVGARPVRLGSEILRTSTAGVLALAVLSGAGRWTR